MKVIPETCRVLFVSSMRIAEQIITISTEVFRVVIKERGTYII